MEKSLDKMGRRQEELSSLFKRLYEDNVLNKIPNEIFQSLSNDYLAEQKLLQLAIPEQEQKLEELKHSILDVDRFIEKAKEFSQFESLSAELLRLFISKVEVGERGEKYSRTASQEVVIHYRDVGLLDRAFEEVEVEEVCSA